MTQIRENERKMQQLMRGMTNGVISERDRLLYYTVGEFYQELSLYVEECKQREKQLEKLQKLPNGNNQRG